MNYFDIACDVLNMKPDELRKYTAMEHIEADRMIRDTWNRINPLTEQEIIEFYTKQPEFTLFFIRLYHNADENYNDPGFVSRLIPYLPDLKQYKILDYGCGGGLGALSLFNNGCKNVMLADIPTPLFEIVRRALAAHIGQDRFFYITEKFPLKEHYDLILCCDVLEHVMDPDKVLKHLVDHTRYLFMTTFFGGSDYAPPHLKQNDKYAVSSEAWLQVTESCGLVPVSLEQGCKINGLWRKV